VTLSLSAAKERASRIRQSKAVPPGQSGRHPPERAERSRNAAAREQDFDVSKQPCAECLVAGRRPAKRFGLVKDQLKPSRIRLTSEDAAQHRLGIRGAHAGPSSFWAAPAGERGNLALRHRRRAKPPGYAATMAMRAAILRHLQGAHISMVQSGRPRFMRRQPDSGMRYGEPGYAFAAGPVPSQ
jgi:hypothetical protein